MTLGGSNVVNVRIVGDSSGLRKELGKTEKQTKSIRDTLKKYSGEIKTFFAVQATRAIKDFVGDSVRAFSDLEQSVGGTKAVFGDASDVIDDFARNSAESIGLAESEFRTATTSIGGQLKRMTGDVDFAAEQSIIATQVAADLAATYGGTTAQAVQALGAAFRGEADPAERFNLDLKIGAVNAKAVALGLAESTSAVDNNAKAQATLALIMEQSADAQGQFAREADTVAGKQQRQQAAMEDARAELGEALLPLQMAWLQVQKDTIPVLVDLATAVGLWTDSLTRAEAALKGAEAAGDGVVDSVDEAVDSIENLHFAGTVLGSFIRRSFIPDFLAAKTTGGEFKDSVREWALAVDLSDRGLRQMLDRLPEIARELDLNKEKTDALGDALRLRLAVEAAGTGRVVRGRLKPALDDATGATEGLTGATEESAAAEKIQAEAIDKAREALERKRDAIAEIHDPLFRMVELNQDLAEAEKAVAEAEDEFTRDSSEFRDAVFDRANILDDLRGTYNQLVADGIDPTGAAARGMLEGLEIPSDVIDHIFGQFLTLKQQIEDERIRIILDATTGRVTSDPASDTTTAPISIAGVAHGGGVVQAPRGQEVIVRALGGEQITNPHFPGGGGGGGTVINYYAGTQIGNDRILRELAEEARRR